MRDSIARFGRRASALWRIGLVFTRTPSSTRIKERVWDGVLKAWVEPKCSSRKHRDCAIAWRGISYSPWNGNDPSRWEIPRRIDGFRCVVPQFWDAIACAAIPGQRLSPLIRGVARHEPGGLLARASPKKMDGQKPVHLEIPVPYAPADADFAFLATVTRPSKVTGSSAARSASILRSTSTPATLRPAMKVE
jgi:hypothetical protein